MNNNNINKIPETIVKIISHDKYDDHNYYSRYNKIIFYVKKIINILKLIRCLKDIQPNKCIKNNIEIVLSIYDKLLCLFDKYRDDPIIRKLKLHKLHLKNVYGKCLCKIINKIIFDLKETFYI